MKTGTHTQVPVPSMFGRELLRRRSGLRRSIGIVYVGLPGITLVAAATIVLQIVLIVETAGLYTPK